MAKNFFNIDDSEVVDLAKDLKVLTKVALPIAIRRTLNDTARAARPIAQQVIRDKMITRNKFTESRVLFQNGPNTLNINKMRSSIGHTQEYMEDQEVGGRTDRSGRYQTIIPSHFASNEASTGAPRRRAVTSAKRLQNIALSSRRVRPPRHQGGAWKSRRQQFFVTATMALQLGKKYFIIHTENSRYDAIIYRITAQERESDSGEAGVTMAKAVYYMRTQKTLVRPRRWLEETTDEATKNIAGFYRKRLNEQAKRSKLPFRVREI